MKTTHGPMEISRHALVRRAGEGWVYVRDADDREDLVDHALRIYGADHLVGRRAPRRNAWRRISRREGLRIVPARLTVSLEGEQLQIREVA